MNSNEQFQLKSGLGSKFVRRGVVSLPWNAQLLLYIKGDAW